MKQFRVILEEDFEGDCVGVFWVDAETVTKFGHNAVKIDEKIIQFDLYIGEIFCEEVA